jgi:hypothetical protein
VPVPGASSVMTGDFREDSTRPSIGRGAVTAGLP